MKLIKIEKLKPIENFGKNRVKWLKKKILSEGFWTKPICIEKNYMLVLDGMHRLEVAKQIGLKVIPCELFNYDEVEVWSLRPTTCIVTRKEVIHRALSGKIYPYKTAKHKFPKEIELCKIPLEDLK